MVFNKEKAMSHIYKGADPVITYDHMAESKQNISQLQPVKNIKFTTFILEELFLIALGITCLFLYI